MKLEFTDNVNSMSTLRPTFEDELIKLIAVRRPYFNLQKIIMDSDGYLKANIPVEMTDHKETPCISLSEVGRHVAILGSLALAQTNPRKEKHYYLASDAIFDRIHSHVIKPDDCYIKAKVLTLNKKEGVIYGQLFSGEGELTYEAEVRYTIIHHSIFERKFKNNMLIPDPMYRDNPYKNKTFVRLEEKTTDQHTSFIDYIDRNDCVGHFTNYPALPVARISGAMFETSGNHYNLLRNSNETYCIRRVEMHAKSFIFTGEKVKIVTTQKADTTNKGILIEAHALTNSEKNIPSVETKCWFY